MSAGNAPLYGPEFSSYTDGEVGWLLTDLTDSPPGTGDDHPGEPDDDAYLPGQAYIDRAVEAMNRRARTIAHLVGVTAEQALAKRGSGIVLVSTVRAGVPIGILMRRWYAFAHWLPVDHYAIGLQREGGVDPVALRWLAHHHKPARIQFVDAWTGKGGVVQEIRSSIASPGIPDGFDPSLAVLADPGRCSDIFGTRHDVLIPSACLNSLGTGLVSSPVPRHPRVGPGDFYGARFLREHSGMDVSGRFLDAVSAAFPAVAPAVAAGWKDVARAGRARGVAGPKAAEEMARRYSRDHENSRVRPGIGETMRALLGHEPVRVLVNPAAETELELVIMLAEQRGLPIDEIPGLPYACAGLIEAPGSRMRRRTADAASGQ